MSTTNLKLAQALHQAVAMIKSGDQRFTCVAIIQLYNEGKISREVAAYLQEVVELALEPYFTFDNYYRNQTGNLDLIGDLDEIRQARIAFMTNLAVEMV